MNTALYVVSATHSDGKVMPFAGFTFHVDAISFRDKMMKSKPSLEWNISKGNLTWPIP